MSTKRPCEDEATCGSRQRIEGPVQEGQLTDVIPQNLVDRVLDFVPHAIAPHSVRKATTSKAEFCKRMTQNSKLCKPLHATVVKLGQHEYDCTAYCSRFLVQKVPEIIECVGEFAKSLGDTGGKIAYVSVKFVTIVESGRVRLKPPQLILSTYKDARISPSHQPGAFKLGKFWCHIYPDDKANSTREQFVKDVSDLGFNAVVIHAKLRENGWIPKCLGENVFSVYKTKCCNIAFRCVYDRAYGGYSDSGDYNMVGSITEKTVTEKSGVRHYLSGKYKKRIFKGAMGVIGSDTFALMEERKLDDEDRYEEDLSRAAPPPKHHERVEEALRSNPEEKRNRDREEFRRDTKTREGVMTKRIGKTSGNRVPSWPGNMERRLPGVVTARRKT